MWLYLQQQHLQTASVHNQNHCFQALVRRAGAVQSIIVALLMKINDRCEPHQSRTLITNESSAPLRWLHLRNVCICTVQCVLTTSRMSLLMSKLGFFFMLRMTQVCIKVPPHSTCRLGEVTLASWKLLRLRTPHAKILQQGQEEKLVYLLLISQSPLNYIYKHSRTTIKAYSR